MSSLRGGIIGLGQMGRNHARVYRSLPDVDLVVLADLEKIPEEVSLGIATVSSAEEMLEHQIDFCIVATPTISHEEIGVLMAEAGVHTLIEKPISDFRIHEICFLLDFIILMTFNFFKRKIGDGFPLPKGSIFFISL